MFNARIGDSVPFYRDRTGDEADKKIYKLSWNSNVDTVFNFVVRALLIDRVEDGEDFRIRYNELTHNDTYDDSSYKELTSRILVFDDEVSDLWMIGVRRTDSAWFDKLSEEVKELAPAWVEVTKVRKFFSRTDVLCFTKGKKTVVIYRPLDGMALETHRYILMGTPVYIPWFFKEKPITKEETEFLETLSKTSAEPFIKALNKMSVIKGIRERRMEASLAGIESRFAKGKLEYCKQEIENLHARIISKREEIADMLKQIRESNLSIEGLKNILNNDKNEVLEFFKANKNLVFKECYGDEVTFYATGYLDVFDADLAEECIDNSDSLIYDYSNLTRVMTEKLFRAVFVDQTVKIKSVAEYQMSVGNFRVRGISNAEYIDEVKDYFPNTHIDKYACLGDYEMMMIDALKEGDTIGCLSLCGMSVRSLNFGDSTVMEMFTDRITKAVGKVFEMDGESYTLGALLEKFRAEGKED